ncbi:H/ACA ribonucleoprotein complex non-core subunit NAF1 [Osmerus eperlanus]|uniref:H/ACA ribonucleoprotein complex non-core subunit NAF1 n=1 Tax=Osmerus eperlanus TaxID=29151 RepID=UPI002E110C1A
MEQPTSIPDGGCNEAACPEIDGVENRTADGAEVEVTSVKSEDDDMEVTVTSHPENLHVTNGLSHTHTAETEADTHTLPPDDTHTQVMLVEKDDVCVKKEGGYISEDSSSDSDSSSSCVTLAAVLGEDDDDDEGFSQERKPVPIRTIDEVLPEDLPAVEEICIILPEGSELQPMGTVSSIIQQLVIIQSLKDTPPLREDSVLFNSDRQAMGKVFEVFGPVLSPFYVLRFNSEEQITQKQLQLQQTLYCCPAHQDYTEYIFIEQLRQMKGSDASWKNDQEPPPEELDFSDDETEHMAKKKKKKKNQKKRDFPPADATPPPPPGGDLYGRPPISQRPLQQRDHRGFAPRREGTPFYRHQGPPMNTHPHAHPHAHHGHTPPHTYHPQYLPPPCPYPPPFQPQGFPNYAPPPPWPPYHTLPFSHLPPPPPPPPPGQ